MRAIEENSGFDVDDYIEKNYVEPERHTPVALEPQRFLKRSAVQVGWVVPESEEFKWVSPVAISRYLTAYNEIVSLIDTNALYNIVSAFNYNNDTLQAMFNSTAIEEFQFILSTDNGVNTLQSLYDSVVIESPHHNESEGNSNTIEDNTIGERKKLDVKELSISERVQLYFVVIELIVSLISSFTDSTEDTLKEMKENSSQQLKIEQQQLDEQVRHNKEMERLQEGNNQALNKIGDELERANNLMEKSGTD